MPRTEPLINVYTEIYTAGFEDQKRINPVYDGNSWQAAFSAANHELEFLSANCLPVEGNTNKYVKGEMVFVLKCVEVRS